MTTTIATPGQEMTTFAKSSIIPLSRPFRAPMHIEGSASELAYGNAIDKRRQVIQAWADHCAMKW